ncbi:hypothetical protein Droror1_Dr00015368 [Drosera rotundifolia]
MRKMKCRIWWPEDLVSRPPPSCDSNLLLFGWFVASSSSSSSVDVVVAFAREEGWLDRCSEFAVEEAMRRVREGLPVSLQDTSTFSLLGCCGKSFESAKIQIANGKERRGGIPHKVFSLNKLNIPTENFVELICGGLESTGLQKHFRQPWKCSLKENSWIPNFHHLRWNGILVSRCDLHIILYKTPTSGGHHFASSYCSSKLLKDHPRRPRWLDDLYMKHQNLKLDTVIMAVNSAASVSMLFDRYLGEKRSLRLPVIHMFLASVWKILAATIALIATMQYIILQFLHKIKMFGSRFWISGVLSKIFSCTGKNIEIRCCQFPYWPVFLKETCFRSQSCVEYAEKAALKRHSLWSSIAVDILLGNLVGFALIFHSESVCGLILSIASQTTDHVLRSGSVWLMGVPAGFKLNTELAGVLGMISLNAIQIWSTLWFYVAYIFRYVIMVAALSGMLFGLTIPASFVIDIIAIVAVHVAALHWLCSLLYSCQIQALSSLWRLFRGRKWNPLRHRLDSYDYTVEQHIVGSLLFTPLLLLLPTTSVFYTFFSIINTTIFSLLLMIEMTISIIHATPYNKIFLWLLGRKRFPSGIWLELVCCQNDSVASVNMGFQEQADQTYGNMQQDKNLDGDSLTMVSFLHSNYLTFGQVLWPHFSNIFSEVRNSSIAPSTYGILTGKRLPTKMILGLPSPLPWMSISYKDYWFICYDSVLSFL